jgi:hypothetical protein
MTETEVDGNFVKLAELCEQHVGPRLYWLHNQIGGTGWHVTPYYGDSRRTKIALADPALLTFILLKIK